MTKWIVTAFDATGAVVAKAGASGDGAAEYAAAIDSGKFARVELARNVQHIKRWSAPNVDQSKAKAAEPKGKAK